MPLMRCRPERMLVTIRYPCEAQGYGTVMNANGLEPIVTRCNGNSLLSPAMLCCEVPQESDVVGEQLLDFLDGRTDGEELLHALYDHVLDEPVPERMRALFCAGSAD